ncbi:MAG: c-type cytochrome [Rhodobacteraceae bacterium]|nr:c-type cytochrome [Paracoccaceae bacterium]
MRWGLWGAAAWLIVASMLFTATSAFTQTSVAADSAPALERLEGHGGPIRGINISKDGSLIFTSSFDNSVGVWSGADLSHIRWIEGHAAAVNVAIALDLKHHLTGGDDFKIMLRWPSGETKEVWDGHQGKVMDLAIGVGLVASAGWDGWIGLWPYTSDDPSQSDGDLAGPTPVFLKGHQSGVNAVAFAGEARETLYSASTDGTIREWDAPGQSLRRIVVKHGFGVNKLVLDEAAGWMAYGATDGVVRVLDLTSDEELVAFDDGRRPILAMALSPDRTRLAFGDGEGYITIVSTETWEIERDFRAVRRGPVWALAFLDEERVLSGGLDDFAAVWPIATGAAPKLPEAVSRRFHVDPETVSNGERQFARKCSVCHTLTPDSRRRAGPSLYGLFGRPAGTVDGYPYSNALTGTDIIWSPETLDKLFDIGPDHYTPGSKMPMQRIVNPDDRTDLITYLRAATDPDGDAPSEETAK